MLRRSLFLGSLAVLVCAVVMVVLAGKSPAGLASALGIWGFVLTAVGVLLAVVSLWTAKPPDKPRPNLQNIQVNKAEQGDVFGVQNGTMNVNPPSRPEDKQRDSQ